jgi:hypothetical protein
MKTSLLKKKEMQKREAMKDRKDNNTKNNRQAFC